MQLNLKSINGFFEFAKFVLGGKFAFFFEHPKAGKLSALGRG